MMYRKSLMVLLFMIIAICGMSCSSNNTEIPDHALEVYAQSKQITYICPGDYPMNKADDSEAFKWGCNVYVSKMDTDDKLTLSGNRNEGLDRTTQTYSGTYYQSGDWFGYRDGVFLGTEKILSEECVGMVASWGDGSAILIITNTEDNSYVYSARLVDEQWVLDQQNRLELGSETKFIYYYWPLYPINTHAPSETMYIITESDLVTLSVGDYLDYVGDFATVTKTVIETPEYWPYLRPTSAVMMNKKLYVGDMFGVLEYDQTTKGFVYYPVDIRSRN
mgnify:CR=1 FL=1